jgi:hypothetical protein
MEDFVDSKPRQLSMDEDDKQPRRSREAKYSLRNNHYKGNMQNEVLISQFQSLTKYNYRKWPQNIDNGAIARTGYRKKRIVGCR